MSKYLTKRLESLEAYVPGEQPQDRKYVKLNTNESPYPPSPEVIAAVHAGMKTVGFSIITDMGLADALAPASISAILANAEAAEPKMNAIIRELLREGL